MLNLNHDIENDLSRIAEYQEHLADNKVRCRLCPHNCILVNNETSRCLSRKNVEGCLHVLNYGKITSLALDPIEKKPLSFFQPGKSVLSVGTFGCNFSCAYCQNWRISQQRADYRYTSPQDLLELAKQTIPDGNIGVAFTYNEPVIWYEYVKDTALLFKEAGISTVLVTNGFIQQEPLQKLLPYIDAMNIDIKAFHEDFYDKVCLGRLWPVKNTILSALNSCHIELTLLIIPGCNDSFDEINNLAEWVAGISPEIPLHISRHHPEWKMSKPYPADIEHMHKLKEIAGRYLSRVLLGNMPPQSTHSD